MAKTKFTHTCGHDGLCDGRNRAESDRRAKFFAQDSCWECRKAAENAAAAAQAQAAGLPALTGSDKQIAYGTTMRAVKMPELEREFAKARSNVLDGHTLSPADVRFGVFQQYWDARGRRPLDAAEQQELLDALTVVEADALADTSAKFWIELDVGSRWIARQVCLRDLAPTAFPSSLQSA